MEFSGIISNHSKNHPQSHYSLGEEGEVVDFFIYFFYFLRILARLLITVMSDSRLPTACFWSQGSIQSFESYFFLF